MIYLPQVAVHLGFVEVRFVLVFDEAVRYGSAVFREIADLLFRVGSKMNQPWGQNRGQDEVNPRAMVAQGLYQE